MQQTFQRIGLMGRISKAETLKTLKKVIQVLLAQQRDIVVSDDIAPALLETYQVSAREELGQVSDLVIVVGGDGSMLSAARDLAQSQVPVLGVNRGRLGFLADVSPKDLEKKIKQVLAGQYRTEKRFLLDVKIKRQGKTVGQAQAFNDAVLSSGETARMIEFDSFVDGVFVNRQRADGLIVSTPTGSTAYALSAGGPIMHPGLDAIVMVPMFPHKLSSRPLVVTASSKIKLVVHGDAESGSVVSCDGHNILYTHSGDEIIVKKKNSKLTMLHPLDHDFYAACRDKLGWG